MKRLMILIVALIALSTYSGFAEVREVDHVQAKAKKITERRSPGEFTQIDNQSTVDIIYTQTSESPFVRVMGYEEDIARIQTRVQNGVLTVTQQGNQKFKDTPTIEIRAPKIKNYTGKGSGSFTANGILNLADIVFNLTGSGNLNLGELACTTLQILSNGSGKVNISKAEVSGDSHIQTNGSGPVNIKQADIKGNNDVQSKGSGKVNINQMDVKGKNQVTQNGNGQIKMNGNSQQTKVENNGSGSVKGKVNATDSYEGKNTNTGNIRMKGQSKDVTTQSTGAGKSTYNGKSNQNHANGMRQR